MGVRPVPASGLSYPLGRGVVTLRPDGTIAAVRPRPDAPSRLAGGGAVQVWRGSEPVTWPAPTLAVDVDEVELSATADGIGLVVRHSFAAGWSVRIAFVNHTLEPLALRAALTWSPPPECPAWALAADATGAYAVPAPDGRGPLLGGELVLGRCDGVAAEAIGLGRVELAPAERHVVQWRWDWYRGPQGFNRERFGAVPHDLVLAAGTSTWIAADDDVAVVAPGVDLARRGGQVELAQGASTAAVEVSSVRGTTRYRLEWAEPLEDVLVAAGDDVLDGPRTPAGVPRLADLDAALVLQWLLVRGAHGDPDAGDDALGLFVSRLRESEAGDGRVIGLLCGEFERTGEAELLDRAVAGVLQHGRPVPGLGLAGAQVCVAGLAHGRSIAAVLQHLDRVADTVGPEDDLTKAAARLELGLTAAPRAAAERPRSTASTTDRVRRIGTALGAGLRGAPVRPLPVDQQAYLAAVLGLLPETDAARPVAGWGVRPSTVARSAQAQVLARLAGAPSRPAHSWLIMGARLT